MNARLYSLYWDNINPEIVTLQKAVCERLGLQINQHRIHGLNHGDWMDWLMTRMDDVDVFMFIDIDCIPLSKDKLLKTVEKAATGILIGAEGADNGRPPLQSYVGAWYAGINRKAWNALGRPSAKPTPHTDVAQLWTDTWKQNNAPVEFIAPTECVEPKWDLPGRKGAYGIATTYGDECFHLFESRMGKEQYFIERCRKILGN